MTRAETIEHGFGGGAARRLGSRPLVAAIALVLAAQASLAQENAAPDAREQLENEMKAAEQAQRQRQLESSQLEEDALALTDSLIDTAKKIRAHEDTLSAAEAHLTDLIADEEAAAGELADRRAQLAILLGGMQSLTRHRPPAVLVSPDDALKAVHSAILLNATVPRYVAEARALESKLAELRTLRQSIVAEQARIAADQAGLEEQQIVLERLLEEKKAKRQALASEIAEAQARIAALAANASSVGMLVNRLSKPDVAPKLEPDAATPGSPPLGLRITEARGHLQLPVSGSITIPFGARNRQGEASLGLTIVTREGAQVVAPFDGRIVFAGPFLDYPELLLIEAGEGYHFLLTGMAQVYGQVGDRLLAGEPIAVMGAAETDQRTGDRPAPELYLEFRKDGEPINPMPWLAEAYRKVSG